MAVKLFDEPGAILYFFFFLRNIKKQCRLKRYSDTERAEKS